MTEYGGPFLIHMRRQKCDVGTVRDAVQVIPILRAPCDGVDTCQPDRMEKFQIEDIQSFRECRWDGALRPVEVALHGDRGAIVEAPFPKRGQVRTGD